MENLNDKIKRFFGIYPEAKSLFATEDGNVFLRRSDCANHARISKQKMFEFTPEGEKKEKNEDPGGQEELINGLKKSALEIDPETHDYREQLKILKALNKVPESGKKVDVIAAFKNLQEALKAEAAAEPANAGSGAAEPGAAEPGAGNE